MTMRRFMRGLGLATLLLCAAGLRRAEADKVLRVSLNTELQILDPMVTTINATRVFAYMVFDTLVSIDNEGRYHPQMLQGWEISPDRLIYTFHLRDGLFWSDGTAVTADDCVASIQRWAKREGFGQQLMAAAQDFHVVDAKTFELHLRRPFAFVIEALGKPGNIIPVMMPARLAKLDASKPVPEVVGSGPFIFRYKDWRPGNLAVFDRNPNYHPRPEQADGLSGGKVVHFDRVELVSIADQATRVAALQTGELDYLEIVPFDFISVLRHDPAITIPRQSGVQQIMAIVSINHATPPFDNVLARRALQAAIAQPDIMAGLGLPADMYMQHCYSIYMCDSPGTSTAGTAVYRDAGVARAKALLAQAGYHGERVVLLHSASSAVLNPIGMVVADQMRKAGFNVDVRSLDYATVAQRRLSKAPVDQGGWSVVPIIWNGIDLVNPLADPTVSNNCNPNNPGWYCDPQLTELLRQYSETADEAKRHALADAIQAAFHANVNVVLGGQFSAPAAYRSNLHDVVPFAFPVFWSIDRK